MAQKSEWTKERVEGFSKPGVQSVYAAIAKRITADFKERRDDHFKFLDLGAGAGLLLVEIKRLFPKAYVVGIDPSEAMLEQARRTMELSGHQDIKIKAGRAEEIPVESGSIDLLMAQFSLHEWEDPKKGFSEIARVMKAGGTVVIRAWNKSCPRWAFWRHNIHHMFKFGWHRAKEARRSHRLSHPSEMVLDLAQRYGLKTVEVEEGVQLFIKAMKIGGPTDGRQMIRAS